MSELTAADDRKRRQDWAGIGGGVLSGAMTGGLIGLAMGGVAPPLVGMALGALTGGALGSLIVSRYAPEEWESPFAHPSNVGMSAPDTP